jgi:hypothetical protein
MTAEHSTFVNSSMIQGSGRMPRLEKAGVVAGVVVGNTISNQ